MRSNFFLFSFLLLFFLVRPAEAALLYFDPSSAEIHRGDSFTVALRVDTEEGECINTVDTTIHYDSSIRAVDVSRGNSILNLWVEPPKINENDHTITFAAGIPGGYCGRIPGDPSLTNILLELVLRSPGLSIGGGDMRTARLWLDDTTQILLNDGFGTNAPLTTQEANFTLLESVGSTITDPWTADVSADRDIPSDFVITLAQEENAFSGKYFITFNALDKQSGIDHYEVMEEPIKDFNAFRWGGADAPWVRAESPYVLSDQSLNSTIRVKALDKAGNERIVTLIPDVALRTMTLDSIVLYGVGGGVLILIVLLVAYAIRKKRARTNIQDVPYDPTKN